MSAAITMLSEPHGLHAANAPRAALLSQRTASSIRKVWPFAAVYDGDQAAMAADCAYLPPVDLGRHACRDTQAAAEGFVT